MSRIVVERSFETPQSDADMKRVADQERPCLAAYQATWKRSRCPPTASAWSAGAGRR
jgi:hypothetical protein